MSRLFLTAGALCAGIAVVLGAFGAHALEGRVPAERLDVFETGVRYQMYHALALLIVGWAAARRAGAEGLLPWAGACFLVGIIVFSGSLYLLVITDTPWLGAVTPVGGLAFIAGWALLVWMFLFRAMPE